MRFLSLGLGMAAALLPAPSLLAKQAAGLPPVRLRVTVENLAPQRATFKTPFWVGFHDGSFDTYNAGQAADALLPAPALESIAEDGDPTALGAAFDAMTSGGTQGVLFGPQGPIAPAEMATAAFLLDPTATSNRYISYVSMLIPSNDAFVANGDPLEHMLYDNSGNFVGMDFFLRGSDVLDAGTEVNDELPMNTAFFGQMMPNTGVDENGVVHAHVGFMPPGSGGILDAPMFQNADFTRLGYPLTHLRLRSVPAFLDDQDSVAQLSGAEEVPPVPTAATATASMKLRESGMQLMYGMRFTSLNNVVGIHLHLGALGENGPVVATLFSGEPGQGLFRQPVQGLLTMADLVGPLADYPLDALAAAIEADGVYVNVHTDDGEEPSGSGPGDFPSGEVRGQLVVQ